MNWTKGFVLGLCLTLFSDFAAARSLLPAFNDSPDWLVTLFGGQYTDNALADEILILREIEYQPSYMAAAGFARVFARPSGSRQWEWEGQIVKHLGMQSHWEFNAAMIHRWNRLPWRKYIDMTLAIGDGPSYATTTPPLESSSHTNRGATRFLNYLLLEASFASPQSSNATLVMRIHHRSGVFGLIDGVHGGSNVISMGMKFAFQ